MATQDTAIEQQDRQKQNKQNDKNIVITLWVSWCLILSGYIIVLFFSPAKIITSVWILASSAFGGLVGFLFGIPHVLQSQQLQNDTQQNGNQVQKKSYDIKFNTNLEQISDWLTKIIVGLGLVELRNVSVHLGNLSDFIAKGGVGKNKEMPIDHDFLQVIIMGAIVYFAIIGFVGGYIITRMYLTKAFTIADIDTMNLISFGDAKLSIQDVSESLNRQVGDVRTELVTLKSSFESIAAENTTRDIDTQKTRKPISSILWVDDNPKNNSLLVQQFINEKGIFIVTALSTEDGEAKFKEKKFDAVISDMGRQENGKYNGTAGLDIIDIIRSMDSSVRIFIFCSRNRALQFGDEAKNRGAELVTWSSTQLEQALFS